MAVPSTASPSSAAPQQATVSAVIYDCSGRPVPRPSQIVLTCADAGWVLGRLKWAGWGRPTATATGEWSQKNCKPDCATGTISAYPATLTVSSLRGTAYTRMTVISPTSPTPRAVFLLSTAGPGFAPTN